MPKKPEKKNEKIDDSSDPIVKNEVIFNIDFEIYHEKGHFVKLKFNWLNAGSLEEEQLETDYLKDWEVVRKDGQQEVVATPDPPAKDDKKKAPAKDPKKGGMEEIDDPTPTVVKFSKNFEDHPIKFTEEVAKKWSKLILKIDIYDYDREQAVDKIRDTLKIDISYFLFPD